MKLLIVKNYYAPKYRIDDSYNKIHAVSFCKCNFNCTFCDFKNRKNEIIYRDYSKVGFLVKVLKLLLQSKCFKFTGGKPSMNPDAEWCLRVVKMVGGYVYFDTNASIPRVVEKLLSENLIDVLAISLKGTSPEEAIKNSNVNKKLC